VSIDVPPTREGSDGSGGRWRSLLTALEALSSNADSDTVLAELVDAAASAAGADRAVLTMQGVDGGEVPTAASTARDPARTGAGLLVPVEARGVRLGDLHIERAGTTPFTPDEQRASAAVAGVAGYVIAEARIHGLTERRRNWLEASTWLVEALRAPAGVAEAAQVVASAARSISPLTGVVLVQAADDGPATVAASPAGLVYPDPLLETLLRDQLVRLGGATKLVSGFGVTGVEIPLHVEVAEPTVLVGLFEPTDHQPDIEEVALLEALAEQLSLALDRARAVANHADLQNIGEQQQTSRDVHDRVIQRLFATGLVLQAMRSRADPGTSARLDHVIDELDETVRHIRRTIFSPDAS
jgi:signal transduction histidine kinase